jgi:hypothetical protein
MAGGTKSPQLAPHAEENKSVVPGEAIKNSLELTERRGNVNENKWPELSSRERSGNVNENKIT